MVLDVDEVIELIEKGASNDILLSRRMAVRRNMHITGKGLVEFLERLDNYETLAQKNLREKLAKSNRSNFSFVLRPTDKIFTAKGGSVNYNLPYEEVELLKDGLTSIADGLDIKSFLKKKVRREYFIDPNGVLFVDINEEGKLETYVVPTNDILWYKSSGNSIDAIIFEFNERKEDMDSFMETIKFSRTDLKFQDYSLPLGYSLEKKYYRVIDSQTDRIFVKEKRIEEGREVFNGIYVENNSEIPNFFGYVPAYILGDEKDNNTGLFESVIEDLLDDADVLLRRMSVMTVHELAHLYPRYWSYAQACSQCGGEGEIYKEVAGEMTSKVCPSCGGTGHKHRTNPSDEVIVPVPKDGDPVLTKMMGYESPDLETAKFYEGLIRSQKEDMFRSMWGTTYETGGKRETATGRFLDAQPVIDRLSDMSYTFSKMHKFLLDCYGKVILKNPKYEGSVTYGRRYIFDSPDDILQKYQEVSRDPVSDITKIDLHLRYLEAEYQDDPIELKKRKKLLKIEPFPALSCKEVMDVEWLGIEEKLKKLYFMEWFNGLKDSDILLKKDSELKEMLNKFIILKNENKTVHSGGVPQGGVDTPSIN